MGFEPTASCVTGKRSNQLSYIRLSLIYIKYTNSKPHKEAEDGKKPQGVN